MKTKIKSISRSENTITLTDGRKFKAVEFTKCSECDLHKKVCITGDDASKLYCYEGYRKDKIDKMWKEIKQRKPKKE